MKACQAGMKGFRGDMMGCQGDMTAWLEEKTICQGGLKEAGRS
jgi:hypothetical protein